MGNVAFPTEDLYRGDLCAPPRLAVAQHSIENYNKLPHDSRDYVFEWVAFATQAIGKCFYNGIGSHSDAGCHVERTSYGCATSFYVTCATLLTAVIVDRCQSCKPCGLALVSRPMSGR